MNKDVEKQDFYDLLGISDDASVSDIKDAFRKVAKSFHPKSDLSLNYVEGEVQVADIDEELLDEGHSYSEEEERLAYEEVVPHILSEWALAESGHRNKSKLTEVSDEFRSQFETDEPKSRYGSGSFGVLDEEEDFANQDLDTVDSIYCRFGQETTLVTKIENSRRKRIVQRLVFTVCLFLGFITGAAGIFAWMLFGA